MARLEEIQLLMQNGGLILIFQRWIQLQVTQWRALDVISVFCGRALSVLEDVNISILLLNVQRQNDCSMLDWRNMIQGLIAIAPSLPNDPHDIFDYENPLDAAEIIAILEAEIPCYAKPRANGIFYRFLPSVLDRKVAVKLYGTVHCEAALAFLLEHPELFMVHVLQSPEIEWLLAELKKVISPLPGVHQSNLLCRVM